VHLFSFLAAGVVVVVDLAEEVPEVVLVVVVVSGAVAPQEIGNLL
jgi:hypothetical protein